MGGIKYALIATCAEVAPRRRWEEVLTGGFSSSMLEKHVTEVEDDTRVSLRTRSKRNLCRRSRGGEDRYRPY